MRGVAGFRGVLGVAIRAQTVFVFVSACTQSMGRFSLIVCEEPHRRTRRNRTGGRAEEGGFASSAADDGSIDAARLCPLIYQGEVNKLRDRVQLPPINFQHALPGRPNWLTQRAELSGDAVAYGIIIIETPGMPFDGALSLQTKMHHIMHAVTGASTRPPWGMFLAYPHGQYIVWEV